YSPLNTSDRIKIGSRREGTQCCSEIVDGSCKSSLLFIMFRLACATHKNLSRISDLARHDCARNAKREFCVARLDVLCASQQHVARYRTFESGFESTIRVEHDKRDAIVSESMQKRRGDHHRSKTHYGTEVM